MSTISTHVLDTETGKPVSGLNITLGSIVNGQSMELVAKKTDKDGRIEKLGANKGTLTNGTYYLHFHTEPYFLQKGGPVFYPFVEITFNINGTQSNYHIPLILSSFGYCTYRGS